MGLNAQFAKAQKYYLLYLCQSQELRKMEYARRNRFILNASNCIARCIILNLQSGDNHDRTRTKERRKLHEQHNLLFTCNMRNAFHNLDVYSDNLGSRMEGKIKQVVTDLLAIAKDCEEDITPISAILYSLCGSIIGGSLPMFHEMTHKFSLREKERLSIKPNDELLN